MGRTPTFGDRLQEFRKRARKTQRELADAIGVDFTYVSKIESGNAQPPAQTKIDLIAKVLSLAPGEREELFSLAEKIPTDLERLFSRQPAAFRLLRTINQSPPSEQADLLEKLIKQAESARLRRIS